MDKFQNDILKIEVRRKKEKEWKTLKNDQYSIYNDGNENRVELKNLQIGIEYQVRILTNFESGEKFQLITTAEFTEIVGKFII